MAYVFRVGPAQLADVGERYCYVVAADDGRLEQHLAASDTEGLEAVASRAGAATLVCEPALAAAARARGLRCEPVPDDLVESRAILTWRLLSPGDLDREVDPDLMLELLEASADLIELAPWRHFDPAADITLNLEGEKRRRMQLLVLPQSLVLLDEGGLESLSQADATRDLEAASRVDSLALTFDTDEPKRFAAFDDLCGLRAMPVLVKRERGQLLPAGDSDLLLLLTCLDAVAKLVAGENPAIAESSPHGPDLRVTAALMPSTREQSPEQNNPYADVDRNAQCPCGSGKKFKRCHLGSEGARPVSVPVSSDALHDLDRRLAPELMAFADRRVGAARLRELVQMPFGRREMQEQLQSQLLLYHSLVDGKPIARHFLDERGRNLDADARAWLEAQLKSRLGLWEVLTVEPGRSLQLVNLLDGQQRVVHEKLASGVLAPRNVVLARVVSHGGLHVFCGIHQQPLGPIAARRAYRVAKAGPCDLLKTWDDAVGASALAAATPRSITNTDGEEAVFVTDAFDLKCGQAQAMRRLAELPGVEVTEDSRRGGELTWLRPGNAQHLDWKSTVLASFRVTKKRLEVTTNSLERADRARAQVERVLGSDVHHRQRQTKALPKTGLEGDVTIDMQCSSQPVDVERLQREQDRLWPGTPMPALEGKTPLDAMRTAQGREEVHWLLKVRENRREMSETERLHCVATRRTLGLTAVGEPLPDADLHRAVGGGWKASETLLDFAKPLTDLVPEMTPKALRTAMVLAETTWNAVVYADVGDDQTHLARARALMVSENQQAEQIFEALVDRKRRFFAGDLRLIHVRDVARKSGEIGVVAEVRLLPGLLKKVEAAGIRP